MLILAVPLLPRIYLRAGCRHRSGLSGSPNSECDMHKTIVDIGYSVFTAMAKGPEDVAGGDNVFLP